MSNYIKNLISTSGWKEIEGMFNEAITECKNEKVNEDLSGDDYKTTSIGNIKAAKKIEKLLRKIKLSGGSINDKKDIKYI